MARSDGRAESLGQAEAGMAENRIRGQALGEGKSGGIRCKTDDPDRVASKAFLVYIHR